MIKGARSKDDAKKLAKAVANSILLKVAIFAGNQNTGRIMAAMGASGVQFNPSKVVIETDSFRKKEVNINIDLKMGDHESTIYTSDLSVDYVKINAGYN